MYILSVAESIGGVAVIFRHSLIPAIPLNLARAQRHQREITQWELLQRRGVKVHVDPKIFDGYLGSYQLAPNFFIRITREGDHLFEQATSQPKFEISPESEKDYFLKVVDAQITFIANSQGQVTGLVLHQNGRDVPGKRIK